MRTWVEISQTVKQTISVRSGNGRRADIAAPGSLSESPVASMGLLITRSTSIPCRPRLVASVDLTCRSCTPQMRVEDHSISSSHVRARPRARLFRFCEIFRCHSEGCLESLLWHKSKELHAC